MYNFKHIATYKTLQLDRIAGHSRLRCTVSVIEKISTSTLSSYIYWAFIGHLLGIYWALLSRDSRQQK
jgi:hypothetical protein